jgi:hypothetical protein
MFCDVFAGGVGYSRAVGTAGFNGGSYRFPRDDKL